jgi:hypothetical protein
MPAEPLDAVPLPSLLLVAAALLWVALEGGYRFGQWRKNHVSDEREQPVGAMVASILGLLALVLGFTFSLVAARFDDRRMGVLEEANAIGTTYLRTSFLPESQKVESARLLREYVAVRIDGVREPGQAGQAIARSEALHTSLWEQADAAAKHAPASIMTGLYIQSLNEVIDLHAKRLLAMRSRIPLVLWIALCFLTTLGMASVGYLSALAVARRSPAMLALVLAFSTVLYLIADLDRSQEGLLRVSQQPMYDLQKSMQVSIP